ncbi:glutamate synthase subunit beta [Hyphomicrobium nitrativorans NL23]|uniref:Chaperone NapD n=1 Tax=Hyphomicrobium nitrativorans NL23 TaxID=1029756 RepID=V5SFH9_9HYPH|nr:chaperone NapD [Hyphomicrobium nitrativorans]AHB49257.1 glutamate synthase subunit beta [Hyphomicrobium nitrativorans NL23]
MRDSDRGAVVHISSAVIRCLPAAVETVRGCIEALGMAEVVHVEGNKLIVIIEGPSSGTVGDCLTQISAYEGVVSAAMVYEQVEPAESAGEEA